MSKATEDILAERKRQVEVEGFSPERDVALYASGELVKAAASYALFEWVPFDILTLWPWDEEWFRVTDYRRDLIKAAALLIAEIERIDNIEEYRKLSK